MFEILEEHKFIYFHGTGRTHLNDSSRFFTLHGMYKLFKLHHEIYSKGDPLANPWTTSEPYKIQLQKTAKKLKVSINEAHLSKFPRPIFKIEIDKFTNSLDTWGSRGNEQPLKIKPLELLAVLKDYGLNPFKE